MRSESKGGVINVWGTFDYEPGDIYMESHEEDVVGFVAHVTLCYNKPNINLPKGVRLSRRLRYELKVSEFYRVTSCSIKDPDYLKWPYRYGLAFRSIPGYGRVILKIRDYKKCKELMPPLLDNKPKKKKPKKKHKKFDDVVFIDKILDEMDKASPPKKTKKKEKNLNFGMLWGMPPKALPDDPYSDDIFTDDDLDDSLAKLKALNTKMKKQIADTKKNKEEKPIEKPKPIRKIGAPVHRKFHKRR